MSKRKQGRKIFISYKKEPLSIAESAHLKKQLEEEGYNVFLDVEELDFGESWQRKIYQEIRTSDVLIVLLQPETAKSEWVQRELDLARGGGVSILPLRVGHQEFTNDDLKQVQEKLVISDIQFAVFNSQEYANQYLSPIQHADVHKNYERILDAIEKLAEITRSTQRKWAKDIETRHARHPAMTNAQHWGMPIHTPTGREVMVYIATGNITKAKDLDVIVNSENNDMQMARFFESHTLSSAIRSTGAYDENWVFWHDQVQQELDEQVRAIYKGRRVVLGQVLVTSAGHPKSILVNNGTRYIFHAATNQVVNREHLHTLDPLRGDAITHCVVTCLEKVYKVETGKVAVFAEGSNFKRDIPNHPIKRIAFPLFGTGYNTLGMQEVVPYMMQGILQFVEQDTETSLESIHLCVYSERDTKNVKRMIKEAIDDQ